MDAILLATFTELLRIALKVKIVFRHEKLQVTTYEYFQDAGPSDMVGLQFRHPSLHKGSFNIPFTPRSQITAERILAIWAMLKQSDEDLSLDEDFEIGITRVPQTKGGRPREGRWNHKPWMKKHCGHGGCFIQISNPDDDLCLARALVVAKARIDKDTDPEIARHWRTIRERR